mgnify:CR=1 FL=1
MNVNLYQGRLVVFLFKNRYYGGCAGKCPETLFPLYVAMIRVGVIHFPTGNGISARHDKLVAFFKRKRYLRLKFFYHDRSMIFYNYFFNLAQR